MEELIKFSRIYTSSEHLNGLNQIARTSSQTLGLFRHDFSVSPDINRRAVHAGGFAGDLRSPAQSAPDLGCKFFSIACSVYRLHSFFSIRTGLSLELSYTVQALACNR